MAIDTDYSQMYIDIRLSHHPVCLILMMSDNSFTAILLRQCARVKIDTLGGSQYATPASIHQPATLLASMPVPPPAIVSLRPSVFSGINEMAGFLFCKGFCIQQ